MLVLPSSGTEQFNTSEFRLAVEVIVIKLGKFGSPQLI
jgi:hypothetical protein